MKRRILTIILCVLMLSSTAYAAPNINNAFSTNLSQAQALYKSVYGWDDSKIKAKEWYAKNPKDGKLYKYTRLAGYQDYYFADNALMTMKYIGLTDYITNDPVGAGNAALNNIVQTAQKELRENESFSKYDNWYGEAYQGTWSVTFICYCAHEAGYLSSDNNTYIKTNKADELYKYFVNSRNLPSYRLSETNPVGGVLYSPLAGDLIFDGEKVGIISFVAPGRIDAIFGDINGKISTVSYTEEKLVSTQNVKVVHVVYK